jgi:hypothetical protein
MSANKEKQKKPRRPRREFSADLFISSFFIRAPMGELRTRPRGRRAALWESFYRPYAIHKRRPPTRRRSPSPRPASSAEH